MPATAMSRLRFVGTVTLMLLAHLMRGEAFFGRRGNGRGPTVKPGAPDAASLSPAAMEETAKKAANAVVMWGTTTIFQLKQAAQLRGHVERLRVERSGGGGGGGAPGVRDSVKMDPQMYKHVVQGALGGVFLAMNSPAMGKVSDVAKGMMKDVSRQARAIALDQKVKEAVAMGMKSKGPPQDPDGFLEGALLNQEVAAAHDRFMADIESLASSGLAKKVASSAEAYHDVMLKYATTKRRQG